MSNENNTTPENNQTGNRNQGKKRLVGWISKEKHKEIKQLAIEKETRNIGDIIELLYDNYKKNAA